jgi:hypothetical protein
MKPMALQIGGTVSEIGKTEKQWLGKLVVIAVLDGNASHALRNNRL